MKARLALFAIVALLPACAAPPKPSIVDPIVSKTPGASASVLIAAAEPQCCTCNIQHVYDAGGSKRDLGINPAYGAKDVTLPPGEYRVSLHCSSGSIYSNLTANVAAKAGKRYLLTGSRDTPLIAFTADIKWRVKVTEAP
jgi:hypothetical protein